MNKELKEGLIKSLQGIQDNEGLCIYVSTTLTNTERPVFIDLQQEEDEGTVELSIHAGSYDKYLFIYTFIKMLEEEKIEITIKDNAEEKDKKYLERLANSIIKKE